MRKIIVHNSKFEVEDVSDSEIEKIKTHLVARGWELSDCWSEVKE